MCACSCADTIRSCCHTATSRVEAILRLPFTSRVMIQTMVRTRYIQGDKLCLGHGSALAVRSLTSSSFSMEEGICCVIASMRRGYICRNSPARTTVRTSIKGRARHPATGKEDRVPPFIFPSSPRRREALHWGQGGWSGGIWGKCGLTPHFVGSALGGLSQNPVFVERA